jgi:hypothetical protein
MRWLGFLIGIGIAGAGVDLWPVVLPHVREQARHLGNCMFLLWLICHVLLSCWWLLGLHKMKRSVLAPKHSCMSRRSRLSVLVFVLFCVGYIAGIVGIVTLCV